MRGLDSAAYPQQKIATTVVTSKHVMARLRVCFIEERSCITSELTGAAIMNNLESKEQVNEMRNPRSGLPICYACATAV
jgi:hypothetical protein